MDEHLIFEFFNMDLKLWHRFEINKPMLELAINICDGQVYIVVNHYSSSYPMSSTLLLGVN